ncbi:hypothetical protein KAX75_00810, partial [candidate division WOR-3 bacterium]|nr:hypothetical protein [candidate division WOR-3 bacterium]
MYKFSIVLMVCLFVASSGVAYAESYTEIVDPHEDAGCMWFDSLNARFVGNWPFGYSYTTIYDSLRDIVFHGSGGGVYVFDVSVPSNPVKISELLHTRGFVRGLAYNDISQILYIADRSAGLEIWDMTDEILPVKLGFYDTPSEAYGVVVSDTFAYIADFYSGLRIINVSDPGNPVEIGFCDTPNMAYDVVISDTFAYVADCDSGLRIINISNPSNPVEIGFCDTPNRAYDVVISDTFAYVADCDSGLRIIN